MEKIITTVFQIIIDVVVGMANYFVLTTFAPTWNANTILVLSLGVTALFAEIWEVKFKEKE